MIDPESAARDRVDDLLERLAHVNLQVVVIAPPDGTRRSAQSRARAAAEAAGRGDLFEAASSSARDAVIRAFSRGGFSGTWAANDWSISVATPKDRLAAAAAFEEAVMAAVVEDLVDDETLDVLRSSTDELIRASGMPSPGSLSALVGPRGISRTTTATVGIGTALVVLVVAVWFSLAAGLGLGLLALVVLAVGRDRLRARE